MLLKSELLKDLGLKKNAGLCFWDIRFFFDQVGFKDNVTASVSTSTPFYNYSNQVMCLWINSSMVYRLPKSSELSLVKFPPSL